MGERLKWGEAGVLFLSVKPAFASLIFSGAKTIELRRVAVQTAIPLNALVYVSGSMKSVVGKCQIVRQLVGRPEEMWELAREGAAISRSQYVEYYRGAKRAVLLELCRVSKLRRPVSLEEIESLWPAFRPPQSYRYVSHAWVRQLLRAGPVEPAPV